MPSENRENGNSSCCHISMPKIPRKWQLFFDFAFTFGTALVYLADIVTDSVTLKRYWDQQWYYAFGFSIGFIIVPSVLLAVLECQFLIKTYGKNIKWGTVILRTLLNVPFQLTVIWYHLKLSYTYMKDWLNYSPKSKDSKQMTAGNRGASMSNLADIDDRANTMERHAIASMKVPVNEALAKSNYPVNSDHTWWKQLTREEWLSHLNKMKLTESMLESLPQLLINLYLIVRYPNTAVIQYISATLSYLSLCGGIVRYDKTRKDNEAERLMVDRTLLHSRVFATRLEWPQILFLSLYKGSFLAARILVFVYFTVYFRVYVLVFIFLHWSFLMAYLVYLWYPTDMHKKTRQLVQADYKFRAYMFLSQDFVSVLHNSLVGIFMSVRPKNYAFLGQPYCYIFWYYFIYIIENVVLFMLPGVFYSVRNEEMMLLEKEYYVVMICELVLNIMGAVFCIIYYFFVHKMRVYSRNAYPQFAKMQRLFCCCKLDIDPPLPKEWTVCKQAETSEIFFLRREKLKDYKSGFTTVVRGNRKHGRNLECFVDDHGKIFYAPRNKLFKKLPTKEEEEMVILRKEPSRQSLDDLGQDSANSQLIRPESQSTVRNERLVGEEPAIVSSEMELQPLMSKGDSSPPPLPTSAPIGTVHLSALHPGERQSERNEERISSPSSQEESEPVELQNSSFRGHPGTSGKESTKKSSRSASGSTHSARKEKRTRDTDALGPASPNSYCQKPSHHAPKIPNEKRFPESPESIRSDRDQRRGRDRVRETHTKPAKYGNVTGASHRQKVKSEPNSARSSSKVQSRQHDRVGNKESSKREDPPPSSHSRHRSDSHGSKNRSHHENDRSSPHKKSSKRRNDTPEKKNEFNERSAPVGQSWV